MIPISKVRLEIASTAATEIALVILSFITGILSARLLGPVGRGEYAIILLWPSMIAGVGNLGIREALVYYQANGAHSSSELAGAAFLIALVQTPVLVFLGWLIIPLLTFGKGAMVTQQSLYFLLVIPLNLLSLYPLGLLRGQMRIHRFNLIRGSVNLFYLFGMISLWRTNKLEVQTLTVALLLSNAIVVILAWWSLIRRSKFSFPRTTAIYRNLFSYGIKNHFGTISLMLNSRLDQMLMAIFLTPIELGWYVVAVSVSGLVTIVSATFEKLLFPKVANAGNMDQQKQIISSYSRYNFSVTLLVVVVVMIMAPLLIPLIYSTSFRPAIWPAEILILAAIFLSVNQNWEAGLRGLRQPAIASQAELFGLLITGISLFVFLPSLRIFGAAIASLVAYFSTSIFIYMQLSGRLGFGLKDLLMPISIAQYIKKFSHEKHSNVDENLP